MVRFIKSTLLCICIAAIFTIPVNVNAAANPINTPAIVFENGSVSPIDLIDKERSEGKTVIYTRNYGDFTKPFEENTHEYAVVNNIVACNNIDGTKGTLIPPNGYVISYTGNEPDFVKNLRVGEELKLINLDIPVMPDMYFRLDSNTVPINKTNSERGANEIILYDTSYGEATKTNAWGMELTVVNDIISRIVDMTDMNGAHPDNNSAIPEDGVVISIHSGSPYYKQIHDKAKPGDSIAVSADNNRLYSADKVRYDAYNPMSLEDNPAAWDEKKGEPYDSYRGPNQLIVYDSSYGSSTGTNPYGYEITVSSEGKIINAGGNDSKIPDGGYVLSGHGDMLKWLQTYALLGGTVVLDHEKKEAAIVFTPESYINMAEYSIKAAEDSLHLAKSRYLDISYDSVQSKIDTALSKLKYTQAQIDQGRYEGLISSVKDIRKDAANAYYMTFESVKVENRAVWLRPRDTGIDEIKNRLDLLKDLNINTIYLETYWSGYAIYPTEDDIMQQNPIFKGFDVLAAYIKEAHSRGIELHAWVENFLVDLPIAAKKPEWMAVSKKGDKYYLENGRTKYYFMNPALPEVCDFLSELYKELIKKYEVDGIQFDYMRYPHSGDYSNDFGYDSYTRQLFTNYTGTDPISLCPGDSLWQGWCDFRAYIISSYAYEVFSEVKSIKPDVQISADIWPDYDKTIMDIYQDPRSWTRQDYIDNLVPMSYYLNEAPVIDDILNTWAFARGHSQVTSGIAAFTKVDKAVLLRQIDAIRASNTNGIAIFESGSLFSGGYDAALKLGAFSTPSAVTNRDPEQSIRILLKEILRKIDDIYIKNNGINTEQGEKYKKLISEIKVSLKDDKADASAAYSVKNDIEKIARTIYSDASLDAEVAERVSSDLNSIINIINTYISKTRFLTSREVKEFQVELPFKALEIGSTVPIKVKAVLSDDSIMYLDRTQYSIGSSNPASVEAAGNILVIKDKSEGAAITIDILDSFSFNTLKGVDKRIEFAVVDNSRYGTLRASGTGYTDVSLDWGHTIVDSDIAGYIVYRNDAEIAKTSLNTFKEKNLQAGTAYTYRVCGFNTSGDIIYESNQITVKTKGPLLLAAK